ncbi:hypothetical protein DSO57_1013956 [Entomophthora muscae]|uniref:Uncharacterized protein n=1 Tax=Entomophthora muscae TaxID=34485 RepID=A0ACC2S7Y7_9FUNG|nr:hypothetical protein DSO57_1013956 [Entomophthora muscae]
MSASTDSTAIKEIKNVKSRIEYISALRGCYQFLEDKPAMAKNFIAQANQSSGGFGYVTFRGQDEDEATFDRELKARDTMQELEFTLESRGKAWTVKEMKALYPRAATEFRI